MQPDMTKNKKSFEEKMKRLEEIAEQMESSKKPLEEIIVLFKEGMTLSKDCRAELTGMEAEVRKVLDENADGTLASESFEGEE